MKIFLSVLIFTFFSINIFSQNKIAIYYGFSNNELLRKEQLDGAASYYAKGGNLYDINFQKNIGKNFSIETGLEYSKTKIEIKPSFYPIVEIVLRNTNIELLTIPVYANYTFLNYFFVNGGALIDFELNRDKYDLTDNQSGIGFGIGIGGKYDIDNFSLIINPFYNIHAVIPFEKEHYQQHLNTLGLKFGVGYNF